MKKYILISSIFFFLFSCSDMRVNKTGDNKLAVGKSVNSNSMVIKNTALTGNSQSEIDERMRDLTGKGLYVPECGYPESMGMVEAYYQRNYTGIERGWWVFARDPDGRWTWSAVDFFSKDHKFVSIERQNDYQVIIKVIFKGKETSRTYRWSPPTQGYIEKWRRMI